jgi:hypothetical protein
MPSDPIPEASVRERREHVAVTCVRVSKYAFLAGVAYFVFSIFVDVSWWGLVVLAIVQSAAGLLAVIAGALARSVAQPVATRTIVAGAALGAIGILGVLVWSAFASDKGGGGFFAFGAWGRPLRIDGRAVHPQIRVEAGGDWSSGEAPDVTALSPATRAALAAWWLLDAQKEHASVPAFARLAWQLVALGAPASLLERCYRAGLQEIDHARRCFALVSAYRGEPLGVLAMPELAHGTHAIDLVALATESLADGCFIEDLNADAAALAATRATDPAVARLVADIARDERDHAELAWDIVAWCVREGGAPIAQALRATAAAIPGEGGGLYDAELARLVDGCDIAELRAHGRVPLADWPALYRERLARTRDRLVALLDQGNTGFISRSSFVRSARVTASSA